MKSKKYKYIYREPHQWCNGQHLVQQIMGPRPLEPKPLKLIFTASPNKHVVYADFESTSLTLVDSKSAYVRLVQHDMSVVSVSQHYNNPTKRLGLVQSEHHHLIELQRVIIVIYLKNCSFGINNTHSLGSENSTAKHNSKYKWIGRYLTHQM